MSKALSAAASAEFDTDVKHAYQERGGLASTWTERNGITGDTYNFRTMGKGMANKKSSSEDVTPMNVSHALVPAVLENWNAPEYTDIFDDAEVNFDEVSELSETIAGAIGRREDQLGIDAMDVAAAAATHAGDVGTNIGGTATDLNTAKIRRSKRLHDNLAVDEADRHLLHSAIGLEAMLGTTEATSSDYNTVKALVHGDIDTFVGYKWHMVAARDEGGLTIAASVRDGMAYQKKAIGIARGINFTTNVDWIPQKTSWLANGILKAGATVRDGNGLVRIQSTEA